MLKKISAFFKNPKFMIWLGVVAYLLATLNMFREGLTTTEGYILLAFSAFWAISFASSFKFVELHQKLHDSTLESWREDIVRTKENADLLISMIDDRDKRIKDLKEQVRMLSLVVHQFILREVESSEILEDENDIISFSLTPQDIARISKDTGLNRFAISQRENPVTKEVIFDIKRRLECSEEAANEAEKD